MKGWMSESTEVQMAVGIKIFNWASDGSVSMVAIYHHRNSNSGILLIINPSQSF